MESDKRVPSERRYPLPGGSLEWGRLSKRDRRFLKRAVERARERSVHYQNHCAIAVKGSKVLAYGINTIKNDPRVLSDEHIRIVPGRNSVMGCGIHAEVAALNKVVDPVGITIYVARVMKTGEPANSAPCEGCQFTLREAGVRRVVWTEDGIEL